jgi:glycosyltransferase involved in cell wall biosynthesis
MNDRAHPPTTGSRLRNRYLWPALAQLGWDVKILGFDPQRKPTEALGPPELESTFLSAPRQTLPLRAFNACLYSYHQWPYAAGLASEVDKTAAQWRPDVLHADDLRMAAYLPALRARKIAAVQTLTLQNVETDLHSRNGSSGLPFGRWLINRIHHLNLRGYERRAASLADTVFAFSPTDLVRYRQLYPAVNWALTSNGANASEIVPAPEPSTPSIFILGTLSYLPNIEGLRWFIREIKPRLCLNLEITVAGSRAAPEMKQALAAERLTFIDTPADLAPLYAANGLSVIPLLSGSGTRGRVLEALAHQRMVITTTKGIEGLEDLIGNGVIVEDDPAEFAAAIQRWAADSEGRAALASRGREAVLTRYDWSRVAANLAERWQACLAH